MIASLRGVVLAKDTQGAVLECHGVGYGLAMSLSSLTALPAVGSEAFVWVHTQMSNEALRLFGFLERAERQTFVLLIGTTGVGPRLALAILSALSPLELTQVVQAGAQAALCAIPGIGKKTADRLLLELQDKLAVPSEVTDAMPQLASSRGLQQDLHSALCNLGFTPQLANRAAQQALQQQPSETCLATLLRQALRCATTRNVS